MARGDDQGGQREPGLLAAGEHAGGLVDVVAGEQERAEHLADLDQVEVGGGGAHVLQDRAVRVEGLVLLRVVAELEAVARATTSPVSGFSTPASSRSRVVLPAPLRPRMTTREPRSMARSTSVKISSEPYDFDRPSAVSGVLPHGAGSGKRSLATLSDCRTASRPDEQLVGAPGHVLRGDGLGGLGAHLVGLRVERGGLLLGVGALALAALLVGLALLLVELPAHVVDVDLGAVGVQVEDLVDDRLDQVDVVGDDDEAAAVGLEEVAQPDDRVGVEVVGRLVEQQGVGVREQDAGQLDAAALTAGEGVQRLAEHPVGQAEAAAMVAASASAAYPPLVRNSVSRRSYFFIAFSRVAPWPLAIRSSFSRILRSTVSRPRADRMRSRARTSRSPVRGSCGR